MRIKLTRTQLQGFSLLVSEGLRIMPINNMADKLISTLMEKLSDRLDKKSRKVWTDPKTPKSISLNDQEAMTLYCWYNAMRAYMEHDYQYEVLVADQIFNEIDREYA